MIKGLTKNTLNFKKNKAKAKEWSEKEYSAWKKTLYPKQQKAIEVFKRSSKDINGEVKKVRGDIDQITDERVKKQIQEMNTMIKQPANQLKHSLVVYIHFDPIDLGYSKAENMLEESKSGSNRLDRHKIENILTKYKYGNLIGLKVGDLTLSGGETGQHFLAEIELPPGTHLGHFGDGQIVLPTDYAIEIPHNLFNKPKIIAENGKEIIKVQSKLVKKEDIQKKIQQTEKAVNKKFNDKESNFIQLDVGTGFESYTMEHAEKAINDFIKNVPSKLVKDAVDQLDSIIFTDRRIPVQDQEKNVRGWFDHHNLKVYLRTNHEIFLQNLDQSTEPSTGFIHEMGHVVDVELFGNTSETPKFKDIYEREKDNLTSLVTYKDYGKSNPQEFFAEVFKAMHSSRSEQRKAVNKEAPDAVRYIYEKIKNIYN